MNENTVVAVILLICFLALPYGIAVLLNGWMFGPEDYTNAYIVVGAGVLILALLALVVKR